MSKPSVPRLLFLGLLLFALPPFWIALLWEGSEGGPHPVPEAAVGGASLTAEPAQATSPRTPIPTLTYGELTPEGCAPPADPEREEPPPLETVLEGRVLGPDGSPLAGAGVSFFGLGPEGPEKRARVTVETNVEGRFRMTLPPAAPLDGLLMAHRKQFRPEALAVTVRPHGNVGGLEFRLDEGAVIRGTITLNGLPIPQSLRWSPHFPDLRIQRGVDVGLDAVWGTPDASISTRRDPWDLDPTSNDLSELLWTRGRPETLRVSVEAEPDGTFQIGGLSPDVTYRLGVVDWMAGVTCHPDVFRTVGRDVLPGGSVHIDVRTAKVRVSVRGDGHLGNHAAVKLVSGTTGAFTSVSADLAVWGLWIVPGAPHVLRVSARGYLPFQMDVPPLQVGEARHIDVSLTPHDDPDVVLTVRGAEALDLQGISVRFFSPARSQDGQGEVVVLRASRTRGDEFLLKDVPLPLGRYTMVVSGEDPLTQMLLPVETTVDLQDGVVEATLEARLGGRCGVAVADRVEEFTYRLRASPGEFALSVTIVRSELTFQAEDWFLRNGATSHADAARRAARLLEPGDYELEVTCDNKQMIRERVVIRAGETTVRRVE